MQKLAILIREGSYIGVSDGSLRDAYPAHAYCLAHKSTGEIYFQVCVPVDGPVQYITSFRAEALGIIALLAIINILFEAGEIEGSKISLYSDRESVIKAVQWY